MKVRAGASFGAHPEADKRYLGVRHLASGAELGIGASGFGMLNLGHEFMPHPEADKIGL
jgi:hypothetical protein